MECFISPFSGFHSLCPCVSPKTRSFVAPSRHICPCAHPSHPYLNKGSLPSDFEGYRQASRKHWIFAKSSSFSNSKQNDDDDADENDKDKNPQDSQGPESSDKIYQRSDRGTRDIEFYLSSKNVQEKRHENEVLDFVQRVKPSELVASFSRTAPVEVQSAFRHSIVSMLGSLPPQLYMTVIRTVAANVVQLMQSSLMTGYMIRNAQYRVSLARSLSPLNEKLLSMGETDEKPKIQGGLAIFKNKDGSTTEIPVDQYVAELRSEVQNLRSELANSRSDGSDLLKYLQTQTNIENLTKDISTEVMDAMKQIIFAVTEAQNFPKNPMQNVETPATELGQMLMWLMVSGYFMKEAEVRLNMRKSLDQDA